VESGTLGTAGFAIVETPATWPVKGAVQPPQDTIRILKMKFN